MFTKGASIHVALNILKDKFFNNPNIISIGLGLKKTEGELLNIPSIVFIVKKKQCKQSLFFKERIPSIFENYPVDIQEDNEFKLLNELLESGVGIGHYKSGFGTLGAFVMKDGENFMLSNNHVLANCNNGKLGDAILLKSDTSNELNKIGYLYDFVRVNTGSSNFILRKYYKRLKSLIKVSNKKVITEANNLVDVALAKPEKSYVLELPSIGRIKGWEAAYIHKKVKKYGNKTGFTEGVILQTSVTCKVKFGRKKAIFTDQILCDMPCRPGDSGALLVSEHNNAIGLIFSGSKNFLLANRIEHIMEALNFQFNKTGN